MHAMHKLEFPTGRVHRTLLEQRKKERSAIIKKRNQDLKRVELIERKACQQVKEELELIDQQASKKAAEILATIDLSTLDTINLEGLD
jgi:hypothetical protein